VGAIFMIDVFVPRGINLSTCFIVLLLLTRKLLSPGQVLCFSVVTAALAITEIFFSRASTVPFEWSLINRSTTALVLLILGLNCLPRIEWVRWLIDPRDDGRFGMGSGF